MWNHSLGLAATLQGYQFSQANQNVSYHVAQQQIGLNLQQPVPSSSNIPQLRPLNAIQWNQSPLNLSDVVMTQQRPPFYLPNTGLNVMNPPLQSPPWRHDGSQQLPLSHNQTSPYIPGNPFHVDPYSSMQSRGIGGPLIPNTTNQQFPRSPMFLNQSSTMEPMIIGGLQRPLISTLPNHHHQFPGNPLPVDQGARIRPMIPNTPIDNILYPHTLMDGPTTSVNLNPTLAPRAGDQGHPSVNSIQNTTNLQFTSTKTQRIQNTNKNNILCSSVNSVHIDSQSKVSNPTTAQFPRRPLDTPTSHSSQQIADVGEIHSNTEIKAKESLTNVGQNHKFNDHGTLKFGYNITAPEIDFTDAKESLSGKADEKEFLKNPIDITLPYKRPKVRSPHKNEHKKKPYDNGCVSPRKRSVSDQWSSRYKQPRYDEFKHSDRNSSPHERKRGSSFSSDSRSRTSSCSSNYSPHDRTKSDRHKNTFTSPSSHDRYQHEYRSSQEDRPLRCVSPPPPDIKRVVKFIVPDEYYKLSKSEKDSKSLTLGTDKLERLYEAFERKILNSSMETDVPDSKEQSSDSTEIPEASKDSSENGNINDDDIYSDLESLDDFDIIVQECKGQYSADTFADANDSEDSDDDYVDEKSDDDEEGKGDSCSDEGSSPLTGPSVKEIRSRKISDPRRLHPDLWFNEKGEGNDGPVCRCCAKDREHGIQHAVYSGEKALHLCNPLCNNADRLYHYWVTVTPHTNFMTERPTCIKHHNRNYVFEGFSILSHQSLDKIPLCSLIRFNIEYSIHLVREPIPKNFCIRGLELFSKFLFQDILDLLDWSLKRQEGEKESCSMFHFMPRFVYRKKDSQNGKEIHELLAMNKVISFLMENSEELVKPDQLELSKQKQRDLSKSCRNLIVTRPSKKPSAFRIDDLQFDDDLKHGDKKKYPLVVHHGIRPVQMSYSGDPKYQKLWKSFLQLRNMAANRPASGRKYHDRLIEIKVKLERMRLKSSMRRDVLVKLSSQGLMKTGIHSDVCQHAMLLPVLVHHLRYHISLRTLDEKLGYRFKDRMLLQLSLSHPSYHLNFGMNPDQARNTLSNCGVKQPRYGDRRIHQLHSKKKGITQLIHVMANLGKIEEHQSMIRHNERLEFLGDAVLEFICSSHLYFMLPNEPEGNLAMFRTALVQNNHLAVLAKSLNLSDYMQFAHGPDLCKEEDMNHAMANCFEALLGAIFLESGLQEAIDLFSRVAFKDEEIRKVWLNTPKHPLQLQQPEGDRHLIPSSPVLQNLQELEESTGISFTHIRLLARAFTHPQVGFNNLTLGDNQRMEFLGDSVLQFVVSIYLYRHFPEHHEGHLTLLRSSLVNNRTQADIAKQLGLDKYINFGSTGPKNIREKLLADVLEAFLAALYVDKGLKHVEAFCRACFFPRVEENIVNQEWIDAKSQLQQCCLTLREEGKTPDLPEYRVLQNKGPAHRKRYQIVVYYKGKRCGKGEGQSIHQAEMAAAKDALSSSYFPELARQKHLLDEKHQSKRTRQYNQSIKPKEKPPEKLTIQEPLWVDNE